MQCPVCTETQLVMTSRQDIEIDYCPKCRGVWLDRGELDKIIERSQREETAVAPLVPTAQPMAQQVRDDYRGDYGHGGGRHGSSHGGSRHGGFLKRLFD
ncbi:MAG: zf-TFIIB domain-containing protein [Burkholderiales bacterium]|nr:zf-TFIIB domain-containing protein [Burkholderiales bacterium]